MDNVIVHIPIYPISHSELTDHFPMAFRRLPRFRFDDISDAFPMAIR